MEYQVKPLAARTCYYFAITYSNRDVFYIRDIKCPIVISPCLIVLIWVNTFLVMLITAHNLQHHFSFIYVHPRQDYAKLLRG